MRSGPSDIIQDNINKEIVKLSLTHWQADHTIEETTKLICSDTSY